ncbi:MAG TPA: hypothetical protein VK989_15190 [Polyangia bacterium]|jgi:hypothetical protein|nr:hypothetical protein [Polyangia bacterium]
MTKRARGFLLTLMATLALACGSSTDLVPVPLGAAGAGGSGTAGHVGAAGQQGAAGQVGTAGQPGAAGQADAAAAGTGGADAGTGDVDAAPDVATSGPGGDAAASCVAGPFDGGVHASSGDASVVGGSPTMSNGSCVPGAFKHNGICACQIDTPTVCEEMCTDVTVDPENCGACGSACAATATCNGGACGPSVTSVVPDAPGCVALHVVTTPGVLYWTDQGHGTVTSLSTSCVQTTIASNEKNPGIVIVAGPYLAWVDSTVTETMTTSTIRRVALTGGTPADVVTEVNATGGILGLASNPEGTELFYSAGTKVRGVIVPNGAPFDVAREELGGIPTALAIDGDTIAYLTELNGDLDVVTVVDGTVASCGKHDPNDPTGEALLMVNCTRAGRSQGAPFFGGLALRNGQVYWSNDGAIITNAATPDAAQANEEITSFDDGNLLTAFIASATDFYLGEDGIVGKAAPAAGSTAIKLARAQAAPSSMALDVGRLYWTTGCAINGTAP